MASIGPERAVPDRQLLQSLARVVREAGLDVAIIGGEARNLWRISRLTYDLDFTVRADAIAIAAVIEGMEVLGFRVTRNQSPDATSGPDFLQLYNEATMQVVEMQAAKTEFQELIVTRARPIDGLDPLRVATPEDLIVLKLIADRHKDQDDLRELAQMENLDWPYIEEWAATWEVEDRLQRLRELLNLDD